MHFTYRATEGIIVTTVYTAYIYLNEIYYLLSIYYVHTLCRLQMNSVYMHSSIIIGPLVVWNSSPPMFLHPKYILKGVLQSVLFSDILDILVPPPLVKVKV